MKVTQVDERTFKVELNDAELEDVMHEAVYSDISVLDVIKSVILMTFVKVCQCRYFHRELRGRKDKKLMSPQEKFRRGVELGG